MTNKEAYENIGLALKCYLPDNLSKDTKDELQESWDTIRKDLEVLKILKKNCFIDVWSSEEHNLETGHYYLVIQESKDDWEYMSLPITENDYQKIKEWLENDK